MRRVDKEYTGNFWYILQNIIENIKISSNGENMLYWVMHA